MRFGFWRCRTPGGSAFIRPHQGKWLALLDNQSLGAYRTPKQALEALAGSRAFSSSSGVDPSTLGLPADLDEWEFVPDREPAYSR